MNVSATVRWIVAAVVGLAAVVVLSLASRGTGFARDEGIYFEASRVYGAWASEVVGGQGALERKARDKAFRVNREHPPAMKVAAGVSARLFSDPDAITEALEAGEAPEPTGMSESQAMRLPAQMLAGLGVTLLIGCAGRRRLEAGLLAGIGLLALPRVFFHAQLHAFDIPIAVASLAVVLAYRRALVDWRWGLALGPILGMAIVIKHNALFIPFVLVAHYLICRLAAGRAPSSGTTDAKGVLAALGRLAPLPFWSMLVLAPLTAWALWPWMWHDTANRLEAYLEFHRLHSYYNMEFWGQNHNQPPMPVAYPFVMLAATVPLALLVLSSFGLGISSLVDWRGAKQRSPEQVGTFVTPLGEHQRCDGVLLTLMSLYPLVLIALPNVPIFGGTKHFMTAYPFVLWAAARGFDWTIDHLPRRLAALSPIAAAALLIPGLWATVSGHPHNLSQYAGWVGGARGAANAGLNRGFWGYDAPGVLELGRQADNELARPTKIYLHDMHQLAQKQYVRDGQWPAGWDPAQLNRADAAFVFHELHMQSDEQEVWNAVGSRIPSVVVTLHDVALTSYFAP